MTTMEAAATSANSTEPRSEEAERQVSARVLTALLRENYAGLAERVEPGLEVSGTGAQAVAESLARLTLAGSVIAVEPDGVLGELQISPRAAPPLDTVLTALAELADPADAAGVAAFTRECWESVATVALHQRVQPDMLARLEAAAANNEDTRRGAWGSTWYDSLAAYLDHPVYPTSRCRLGLSEVELSAYAPEFYPRFALRWLRYPPGLIGAGEVPGWWPRDPQDGHPLLPVHPLTARHKLAAAQAARDLAASEVELASPLTALPTLSMRTLAIEEHREIHLKVPLPTSTLGLRNRRHLPPRSLSDGALVGRVLQQIAERHPGQGVLIADESSYLHADHPYLACLIRRFDPRLSTRRVVSVAALGARAPSGRLVAQELADECFNGDVLAFFDTYLGTLFSWQVLLFARYGIALESHQQNTALVLTPGQASVELLIKDHDGALVELDRLAAALGKGTPTQGEFADPRMLTRDRRALAAVFTTITLHLCAAGVAESLSAIAPRGMLFAAIRSRLIAALDHHAPHSDELRRALLTVDRLPAKSMVTAGTLTAKERTGAADINKFYGTTAPNYLLTPLAKLGGASDSAELLAATASAHALFRCLLREMCHGTATQASAQTADDYLELRLPHTETRVRARLRAPLLGPAARLRGSIEEANGAGWSPITTQRLAELTERELTLDTGAANSEFTVQVADSEEAIAALAFARQSTEAPSAPFLASEQSLIIGHPCHPSPKARQGKPTEWLAYSPEAHARFQMEVLAIAPELVVEEEADADTYSAERTNAAFASEALGVSAPTGYRLLPAHPWQLRLLADRPAITAALADGRIRRLGPTPRDVWPTSSVRTVYDPALDRFYKFSLDIRITNCVRKNSWYELRGAVALTRILRPIFAELTTHFPGTTLLGEGAYRTAALADRSSYEGLSVIVRDGVRDHTPPGGSVVLAAAIAAGHALPPANPTSTIEWWSSYVERVVPVVLHAFLAYGVVLEPHLQNVLITLDGTGAPVGAIFRDLEGTKLVPGYHDAALRSIDPSVVAQLTYDAERGWRRVSYCLLVNHLAEIAATLAERSPGAADELWPAVRRAIERYANRCGRPPRLAELLAGAPLPAKTNLRARWAQSADRDAEYVWLTNPLLPNPPSAETPSTPRETLREG